MNDLTRVTVEEFISRLKLTPQQLEAAEPAMDRIATVARKSAENDLEYQEEVSTTAAYGPLTPEVQRALGERYGARVRARLPEILAERAIGFALLRPHLSEGQASQLDEILKDNGEPQEQEVTVEVTTGAFEYSSEAP